MTRPLLSCGWLIALPALFFASSASRGGDVPTPHHDNSNFRLNQITLKHKTSETGPWISGDVSSKAIALKFEVEFAPPQPPTATLPPKILLQVDLRRICGLPGPGGNFLTARFQEAFNSVQQEVTIKDRIAEITLDVHSARHQPTVCQFPHDHNDSDDDHLGEGPYEAFIIAGNTAASPSLTKVSVTARAEPTVSEESTRLVHSLIFSTCKTRCDVVTDSQLRNLLKEKPKSN